MNNLMRASQTITLDAPVNSYGEAISALTMAPPTGKDILECGYPFSVERNPRTGGSTETVNVPAVRLLISRCCQVPEGTVDQLVAVDYMQAVETLKLFFYYKSRKASSTSTSAPEDGQAT